MSLTVKELEEIQESQRLEITATQTKPTCVGYKIFSPRRLTLLVL